MPRQILPHLYELSRQVSGILNNYIRMLDDEFLFGSGAQVPQVATIFDRISTQHLHFHDEELTLVELLTLILYRYGLQSVQVIGQGGYAIVLGNADDKQPREPQAQRRVVRLVPAHHVRDIIAPDDAPYHEFDVRLDHNNEPIRDPKYPLLLSDLFLMPRHTTKLVFYGEDGNVLQAGGYPAILHCQFLPEVRAFNKLRSSTPKLQAAGDLLEAGLATLGVSVADAHGGNGGVLMGADQQPIVYESAQTGALFIPIVLDYGYYAQIGARTLADVLTRNGVTKAQVNALLTSHAPQYTLSDDKPFIDAFADVIQQSGLSRMQFGRLLYDVQSRVLPPYIWVDSTNYHWRTVKEKAYPPLRSQSRLNRLYPDFDEVIFPQRIEEYHFTV